MPDWLSHLLAGFPVYLGHEALRRAQQHAGYRAYLGAKSRHHRHVLHTHRLPMEASSNRYCALTRSGSLPITARAETTS